VTRAAGSTIGRNARETGSTLGGLAVVVAALQLGNAVAQGLPTVEPDAEAIELAPLVVTATRSGESTFDLPVAIDVLDKAIIQDQKPMVLISEDLPRVPGTVVTNRGTYAQEEQIMIRGFGGRAQFGTRGVKLIADGIPASTPDGQGGPGLFDLGSARSIEVMRGGFSALYGNHSGGVVQVFTEDGPPEPTLSVRLMGGSDSTWIAGTKLGGQTGRLNYVVDLSRAQTDGYRDWSRATKEQANSKLGIALDGGGTLSLIVNALNLPEARDPLGLTAEEVKRDRRQASPAALSFQTRRTLDNLQGGVVLDQPLSDADDLRVMAYTGTRSNEQYLAIPLVNQNAITASGGVSAFDRRFAGGNLLWTRSTTLSDGPLTLIFGGEYDRSAEARTGYLNDLGERAALKREEDNTVDSWGTFAQGTWGFAPAWSLDLGLRYTEVRFDSDDGFICTPGRVTAPGTRPGTCSGSTAPITATNLNPDDSGSRTYGAWTPALGLLYNLTPSINLYANLGKTFETPTFTELAYRPDGGAGLNLDLDPAVSRHYEIGAKFLFGADARLNLALFQIDTDDELTVATNGGGRATYRNAPASRRRGVELLLESSLGRGFAGYLAATYLDSAFTESFPACAGIPCRTVAPTLNVTTVEAGNRIPGVPAFTLFGELSYAYEPLGFEAAVSLYGQDKVYVNDRNSETAPAYWLANLRGGFTQDLGGLRLSQFLRIDNLLDEPYISAVSVNASNGRFYAPGPGTNYLIGITASYSF
jgi:iron complex outermembrane receptor protein